MSHSWPDISKFSQVTLEVLDRACLYCDGPTHVRDYKRRPLYTLESPLTVVSQMTICVDEGCAGHHELMVAEEETMLAPPLWILAWDAFAHLGQARFGRHMSVPEIREELRERFAISISEDCIEDYIGRYQAMVAARQSDLLRLKQEYRDLKVKGLLLSIDGLQPEKGHETLYTIRELNGKRVWFAAPLLSSSHEEVKKLFEKAKAWAAEIGLPIQGWVSDKQDAFVTGIAEVFPGVPHRYCQNHFLRDIAKPMLDADSEAKVKMRAKVRGLRTIEKEILARSPEAGKTTEATERDAAVLGYCAAVRGILNKNQGGPLDPPGLRMAEGLKEVRESIEKCVDIKLGGEPERDLKRLGACIDRGIAEVAEALEKIPARVGDLRDIYETMDAATGTPKQRLARFQKLKEKFRLSGDQDRLDMAEMMNRWEPGLFAGGAKLKHLQDNLDLERWFRLPKRHERKIHGRKHAGVRIVQEGPSIMLALDAHHSHPQPFTYDELQPYLGATPSPEELEAVERRKIMRKAVSRKARGKLLPKLEESYAGNPSKSRQG